MLTGGGSFCCFRYTASCSAVTPCSSIRADITSSALVALAALVLASFVFRLKLSASLGPGRFFRLGHVNKLWSPAMSQTGQYLVRVPFGFSPV